jgi:hypothetical protein
VDDAMETIRAQKDSQGNEPVTLQEFQLQMLISMESKPSPFMLTVLGDQFKTVASRPAPVPSDGIARDRKSLGSKAPPKMKGPFVSLFIFVVVGWAVYVPGFQEGTVPWSFNSRESGNVTEFEPISVV